jgi:hypothetical protein
MANDNTKKEDIDIFIANDIYPDPVQIFNSKFKTREEIKNDCFIVLDTNVLLLPYTTSEATLEGIKNTYTKLILEKRLIVPGQVAREFAKNRATKLSELYQNISTRRDSIQLTTQDDFYPLLENLDIYKQAKDLENELHKIRKKYNKKVREILDHIKQWNWNDPVSSLYSDLFSQEVILDIELKEIKKEKIKDDLKRRDVHKIAPGYKDSSKTDQGIGDLLIWQTILEIGEIHKKSVIFVSGEEKPDWWHRTKDQRLYPRYELVEEFRRNSEGQSFYMINLADLLKLYGATEEVVEEVKQEEERASNVNVQNTNFEQTTGQVKVKGYQALRAVSKWLNNQNEYQKIFLEAGEFLDIIAISNKGYRVGVGVEVVNYSRFPYPLVVKHYVTNCFPLHPANIQKLMLFFVSDNEENILSLRKTILDYELNISSNISIIGGCLDSDGKFQPIIKFGS